MGGRQARQENTRLAERRQAVIVTHAPDLSINPLWATNLGSLNYIWGPALSFELSSWRVFLAALELQGETVLLRLILFPAFFSFSLCLSVFSFFFPIILSISLSGLALLNISSYVSDTFARISWNAGDSQQDSQFYVAYMNNRKLSSPALSLDAVFLKQTVKVTAKSINQLQHQNCSEQDIDGGPRSLELLCLSHYFYWGLGKLCIRSKVKSYQIPPKFTLLLRDSGCCLWRF